MEEYQIALIVVGVNVVVLCVVIFAAYLFNKSARKSDQQPRQ
jgi:hypothetical protein